MAEQFGRGEGQRTPDGRGISTLRHHRLGHRAESGRLPISDSASELRRMKPRRRDEKSVLDNMWGTAIPGSGTIGIFDRLPVSGTGHC
jgi:hypothetical protein